MGRSRRFRTDRERRAMFANLNRSATNVNTVHETTHEKPWWETSFSGIRSVQSHNTNYTLKKYPKKESQKPTPETNQKLLRQPETNFSKVTKSVQNISPEKFANLLAGGLATGLSIAIANPAPILIYKSIKTAEKLSDLSNNLEKTDLKEDLKDIANTYLEATGQEILKQKIELISEKVTEQSEGVGLIKLLSESSDFDENAIRSLFKNTVNNVIDDSMGTLTSLVVDTLL